jgi:hypothetical protein
MKFNCKTCGCNELTVTHQYDIVYKDGRDTWQESGPLDDNHHWSYENTEKLESQTEWGTLEEREYYPDAPDIETMTDPDSHEYFVNCAGCDREIEFGWSHPDRAGRIWPAECDDFTAGRAWLEPRYEAPE